MQKALQFLFFRTFYPIYLHLEKKSSPYIAWFEKSFYLFCKLGDRYAPPEVQESANLLKKALTDKQLENIENKINKKYNK